MRECAVTIGFGFFIFILTFRFYFFAIAKNGYNTAKGNKIFVFR